MYTSSFQGITQVTIVKFYPQRLIGLETSVKTRVSKIRTREVISFDMPVIVDCLQVLQAYWPQVLAVLVTGYFIRARYQHGLSDIPGPFIASFTDLWQFYRSLRGLGIEDYKLHEKYNSPLVRVGPNTIAVSDPDACRIIFGYKTIFKKVGELQKQWIIAKASTRAFSTLLPSSPIAKANCIRIWLPQEMKMSTPVFVGQWLILIRSVHCYSTNH